MPVKSTISPKSIESTFIKKAKSHIQSFHNLNNEELGQLHFLLRENHLKIKVPNKLLGKLKHHNR